MMWLNGTKAKKRKTGCNAHLYNGETQIPPFTICEVEKPRHKCMKVAKYPPCLRRKVNTIELISGNFDPNFLVILIFHQLQCGFLVRRVGKWLNATNGQIRLDKPDV